MIAHYLRTALQNLRCHKFYTLLNVAGLVAALATSIVIFLFARFLLLWDDSHTKADRIHLVYKERQTATGIQTVNDTWTLLLDVMTERYPAVETGARVFVDDDRWVALPDQRQFRENITYADPAALQMFTLPFALGDAATALSSPNGVVLSSDAAQRYFGGANPLGQVLTLNANADFIVTGVLEDLPQNSTIRPTLLASFESVAAREAQSTQGTPLGNSFVDTYVLLHEGQTAQQIEAQLPALVNSTFGEDGQNGSRTLQLKLWPFKTLHDRYTDSNAQSGILLVLAFSIILVATINFTNLSIARSLERAKEVGLRKTLGSSRGQLGALFLIEPIVVMVFALPLSVELARALLPVFNSIFGYDLQLSLANDSLLLLMLIATGVAASLLSGFYPAMLLSRLGLLKALRGNLKKGNGGVRLRNGLIFVQFTLAIMLVAGVFTVWLQVRYMQNQPLNFEPAQVVVIPVNIADFGDREAAAAGLRVFKSEVRKLPGVVAAASSMSVPWQYEQSYMFARPEGSTSDSPLRVMFANVDEDYFRTFGISFVEGQAFSAEAGSAGQPIIINERMRRDLGWETAVGKTISDMTVVGVVRDFHYQSLMEGVQPLVHRYEPDHSNNMLNFISVKLDSTDSQASLAAMAALWQQLDPSRPFNYYFLQDRAQAVYQDINDAGKILGYFALLSVVVANLGLLGLSSYMVIQRTKEIGIRRVLGSSVAGVVMLLSRQFMRPVVLANVVAWPLALFLIQRWLQGFANRVETDLLLLPLGGIVIVALALMTISVQSIKSARVKPALALRYE